MLRATVRNSERGSGEWKAGEGRRWAGERLAAEGAAVAGNALPVRDLIHSRQRFAQGRLKPPHPLLVKDLLVHFASLLWLTALPFYRFASRDGQPPGKCHRAGVLAWKRAQH